jgi:hypothetical protein
MFLIPVTAFLEEMRSFAPRRDRNAVFFLYTAIRLNTKTQLFLRLGLFSLIGV